MAGLQQYNFFPTDLLYPRPPSSVPPATVLPLQLPKQETTCDHLQNQPLGSVHASPSSTSSALVISHKPQSPTLEVDKKPLQLPTYPLSLHFWVAHDDIEDEDSQFSESS